MSIISLRLPDSLHDELRKLARKAYASINHLATLAIAEKISALETEEYIHNRASRADRKKFLRAMNKVANRAPNKANIR